MVSSRSWPKFLNPSLIRSPSTLGLSSVPVSGTRIWALSSRAESTGMFRRGGTAAKVAIMSIRLSKSIRPSRPITATSPTGRISPS